jgi:hypothetical protein
MDLRKHGPLRPVSPTRLHRPVRQSRDALQLELRSLRSMGRMRRERSARDRQQRLLKESVATSNTGGLNGEDVLV